MHTGKARIYDQYMEKQRNDKFFASLKNQKPVYRVKEWEDSYKLQVRKEIKMAESCSFVTQTIKTTLTNKHMFSRAET